MQNILAVAIGGALGALCRYGASVACVRWFAAPAVYATFVVNVVGCFCLGLFAASPAGRTTLAYAAIAVGFLGGFTTFSTFGLDTVRLLQTGATSAALFNIGASVIVGLGAVALGLQLGRGL
jgi:CrcB protein